jgi:sigma-B regulation protein RsbU (phosphoserine phosphatase)
MALVKSALTLLVEDRIAAPAILARLHRLLRNKPGERSFVTASLSLFDPASGSFELTNAGHPPAYIVRGSGEVEEILAPGMPLGAIGAIGGLAAPPGEASGTLAPGDALVWLSDGLIECVNSAGEQFGYDRVRQHLAGVPTSAAHVRDRLLGSIRRHTAGLPADDDRTLVVMVYRAAQRQETS